MNPKKKRSRELIQLCAQLSQWRQEEGGGRGTRIPEELWQEAIRVAHREGLYRTARAARLNYARLQQRSRTAGPAPVPDEKPRTGVVAARPSKSGGVDASVRIPGCATFIPLPALSLSTPAPAAHTTIEMVAANGNRMRLEVQGSVDVAGLIQTFWRCPS